MRLVRDFIIVKVPSVFIDETKYKGLNGMNIMLNVFHRPEHHTRNYGIVVSTPISLGKWPIISQPTFPGGKSHYRRMSDIPMDIEVGDKVYFHYNCLLPDTHTRLYNYLFVKSQKEIVNGKEVNFLYFRIKYDLCFAVVRYHKTHASMKDFTWDMEEQLKPLTCPIDPSGDEELKQEERFIASDNVYRKEVKMIGSYVFVEPDMETWEDISIPIPQVGSNGKILLDDKGNKIMKPKDQWIVSKAQPEERDLEGWVRHIGPPLKGDHELSAREGTKIIFRPHANTKLNFEGKDYFRMRQRHIIAYV